MRRRVFCYLSGCLLMMSAGCLLISDPPLFIDEPPTIGWVDVAIGGRTLCSLHESGRMWCGRVGEQELLPDDYLDVSAGERGLCGVRTSGAVACGNDLVDDYGVSSSFVLSGSFVEVSGDGDSGCARSATGRVRCWPGAHDLDGPFRAVGAGGRAACGISRADSRLECWSLEDDLGDDEVVTDTPSGSFLQVSTCERYACAATKSGSIRCWGTTFDDELLSPPSGEHHDFALGYSDACAAEVGVGIQCWGSSVDDPNYPHLRFHPGVFEKVALGVADLCAIGRDTSITCWSDSSD